MIFSNPIIYCANMPCKGHLFVENKNEIGFAPLGATLIELLALGIF
jgi:hypothetical protein